MDTTILGTILGSPIFGNSHIAVSWPDTEPWTARKNTDPARPCNIKNQVKPEP